MSRLYDTVEPNVLKEDFLSEIVREQKPPGEAGRLALEEGIEFCEVTVLRLDFKNILRIDNLWQFENLTKLQLDNNIIEEIRGLESLVNLEWLDLSFNNIECIQGLQSLLRLKDLSLAHNHIKMIDGLDSLQELQVLSIGHNLIQSVDNVLCLRQFKKLASLNMADNPFCTSHEHTYPKYVLASLPQLVYLDFKYITAESRAEASTDYQELLDSLELKDRETERMKEEEARVATKVKEYKAAYVDGLDECRLLQALFEEDKDIEQIRLIPGVTDMLEEFEKKFDSICQGLVQEGLVTAVKRDEERCAYFQARDEALQCNKQTALDCIVAYDKFKADLLSSVQDQDQLQSSMHVLSEEHHRLKEQLLRIEVELVEQIDEMTKSFERQYSEMIQVFQENVQAQMTQCRELESTHHEQVSAMASQLLERFSKNQLEDDECPDQLRMLLVDKDAFFSSLTSSHDAHFLAIDTKEDSMLQAMHKDKGTFLLNLHEQEFARNRSRVVEVTKFLQFEKDEMEVFEDNFSLDEN